MWPNVVDNSGDLHCRPGQPEDLGRRILADDGERRRRSRPADQGKNMVHEIQDRVRVRAEVHGADEDDTVGLLRS